MKKFFLKTKIIIGIWILSSLLFSFLHSELGFLSHNENNHSEHDFCNLVDDSTPPTIKIVKINLILFKDFISIKQKSLEQNLQVDITSLLNIDKTHFLLKTSKAYLAKNSFLI
jgi:hypothetical protein